MAKKAKKEVEEAEVPISSMIDVVFLLIIFFVVTAAIDKEIEDEAIRLCDAPHGKPIKKKDPRSVTINVRKDGSTNIAGMPLSLSQITTALSVSASKFGVNLPIIIRGDKDAQHEYIKKVMEAITDTKMYRVKFQAVIEEGKK